MLLWGLAFSLTTAAHPFVLALVQALVEVAATIAGWATGASAVEISPVADVAGVVVMDVVGSAEIGAAVVDFTKLLALDVTAVAVDLPASFDAVVRSVHSAAAAVAGFAFRR